MKIVSIFAENLFAFHFDDEVENELTRLMNIWTDAQYVDHFVNQHQADIPAFENVNKLTQNLINSADEIDDALYELSQSDSPQLDSFFKSLHNQEYRASVVLSRQKNRNNYLRIYALKIESNCFVITGGAIKFTHLMEERAHTQLELQKLEKCRNFLKDNDVFDKDSFYEFLSEEQ